MTYVAGQRRKYIKHGYYKHPLYSIHRDIKERCTSDRDIYMKNYRDKGVQMCEEWLNDPSTFINWALQNGWKKGMQIDKDIKAAAIGMQGTLYSPELCSIVTAKENNRRKTNTRLLTVNGETKSLTEWGEQNNLDVSLILHRINRLGWSIEKAVTKTEFKKRKKITMEEANKIREMRKTGLSCKQISEKYGMDVSNVFLIVGNKIWKTNEI